MPSFSYKAVDARGAAQQGLIESSTRGMAVDALQRRGLIPISIDEGTASAKVPLSRLFTDFSPRKWRAGLSPKELLTVTQSLAALLKAGLTIDRAMAITTSLNKRARVRTQLAEMGRLVRSGKSFADALKESEVRLPPYFVSMVQAGEIGGSLPQTLTRLAELLRKQHETRERIRSALIYPTILAGVVLLTVILLLVFVLPRFQALFAESETRLPWPTRVVLAAGNFVSSYWWLLGLIAACGSLALIMFIRSPKGRLRIDAWLLRTPLVLGLPASIDTARLLRTLSTLLGNGLTISSGIHVARGTLVNTRLRRALDEVAQRIKAGESTSASFAAAGVFPAQAVQLARVGEETGRLEDLLSEAATILEDESQTTLERLLTLMVPLLTIVMGSMIAGLIGSVLLGLLSINELAF